LESNISGPEEDVLLQSTGTNGGGHGLGVNFLVQARHTDHDGGFGINDIHRYGVHALGEGNAAAGVDDRVVASHPFQNVGEGQERKSLVTG